MLRHERALWRRGASRVAGVDEAGRGPLAGPVVAAAVVLDPRKPIPGLADSKRLTPSQREGLARRVREEALAWALWAVEAEEVDRLNVLRASLRAMARALAGLSLSPEHVLVDGPHPLPVGIPQTPLVGGDGSSASVAAASILAKVARDAQMVELDGLYPGYGFARHKGYATRDHLRALRELGPSPCHRRSFRPVREALGELRLPGLG